MQDFYRRHYKAYHQKTFHIDPSSFLEPLIRHLTPGDTLLDVGCGSGRDLLWFKEHGIKVTGFERSEGLAALARKYVGCEIVEGDLEHFDFSKQTFDAILLCGSLVHIPHAQLEAVFRSVMSGLGEGGKALVSLKEGKGSSISGDDRVFYLWQNKDLGDIFSRHGFSVLECQRGVSKVNSSDTWLSYVLLKGSRVRG